MTTNVETIDRFVPAAFGIVLLYLAFSSGWPAFAGPLLKYGAAIVGLAMLATSALKLCPFDAIFGIKTYKDY